MPTIATKNGAQIYYQDWRAGQLVVFSHGRPLSADAWGRPDMFLAPKGYRLRAVAADLAGDFTIAKAVLIGAVSRLLLKTPANPSSLPIEAFDAIRAASSPTARSVSIQFNSRI